MGTIKDKVAIVGMGCTKFGELWDKSLDDLIIDAAYEAFEDANIEPKDIEAAWLGITQLNGAVVLAAPLKLRGIPITRVENYCGTGMEAIRNASFGVASGMYDVVLALGVEKLKDSGLSGLPDANAHPLFGAAVTPPGRYAMAATRYFHHWGITPNEGKRTLAEIAVKNHANGLLHPKAHFRMSVTVEQVMNAPIIAWPLGLFDCCGTTDGCAAAILTRADIAKNFRDDYVLIKGIGLALGPGLGKEDCDYDYLHFPETEEAARQAYAQAGVTNPREEIDIASMHDCFTIAELMLYESLGLSEKGKAKADVEAGTFTIGGILPVNTDGGLKSFGHPVGATGIRATYEIYKQLQGKAELPERQLKKNMRLGLAQNQGGHPGCFFPIVTILGCAE